MYFKKKTDSKVQPLQGSISTVKEKLVSLKFKTFIIEENFPESLNKGHFFYQK